MRTIAVILTGLLTAAALLIFVPSPDGVTTSSSWPIGAALVLVLLVAALGYWRGARWGAVLLVVAALFAAFIGQADHTPLALGPVVIDSKPTALFSGVGLVILLVVLSWRGLGKRATPSGALR